MLCTGDACGWIAALISCLGFGTFGVPIKGNAANRVDIDPLVMQSYKTTVCFCTSWLVLLGGQKFSFTPWGIVSGLFWVPGGVAAIYAIRNAGLAVALGVNSSLIVLVSFTWGIIIFKEGVRSKVGSCVAIALMIVGLWGMSYYSVPPSAQERPSEACAYSDASAKTKVRDSDDGLRTNSRSMAPKGGKYITIDAEDDENNLEVDNVVHCRGEIRFSDAVSSPLSTNERVLRNFSRNGNCVNDDSNSNEDDGRLSPKADGVHDIDRCSLREMQGNNQLNFDVDPMELKLVFGRQFTRRRLGLVAAAFNGLWGGSIMVPMHFASATTGGLGYVISFAIGASIVTISLWIIRYCYNCYMTNNLVVAYTNLPSFHLTSMWFPGGLAGTLWSVGNVASIVSVQHLGEGVGYSVIQSAMLVSGLWGIFWFREIRGASIIRKWFAAAVITVCGIFLLSREHLKM